MALWPWGGCLPSQGFHVPSFTMKIMTVALAFCPRLGRKCFVFTEKS